MGELEHEGVDHLAGGLKEDGGEGLGVEGEGLAF